MAFKLLTLLMIAIVSLGLFIKNGMRYLGRFKDYISTPKINDYQSIHTTILGPDNNRIELQIRTSSMNDLAERVSCHRNYKDKSIENERQNYPWLDDLPEMLEQSSQVS